MANCETKFQLILLNSPGRYDYGKIHWSGSDARVASGHDGPTRHQRRALSARRSVGRITSQWKLRSLGNHRDGVASLAIPDTRRRTEDPRISESTVICELTLSIRARAVQLRREQRLRLPDAIICATALEF